MREFILAGGVTAMLTVVTGCTTVAQVTTLDNPACKSTIRDQLNSVFLEQGEKPDIAERLAVIRPRLSDRHLGTTAVRRVFSLGSQL